MSNMPVHVLCVIISQACFVSAAPFVRSFTLRVKRQAVYAHNTTYNDMGESLVDTFIICSVL